MLPETYRTPNGLTVRDASPDLLRELLEAYDFESGRRGVPTDEFFAPGLAPAQIRDQLQEIGLVPNEELVVWWAWHNGVRAVHHISYLDQIDLNSAIAKYRNSTLGTSEFYEWDLAWIKTAGSSNSGMAVRSLPCDESPLVRFVSPTGSSTQANESETQVVSICTQITWTLVGMDKGWVWWNRAEKHWETNESRVPLEWALTELV